MDDARIAVNENNLGIDRYEAMELIAGWGVGGVHITATGPFEPEAGFNGFYAIEREVRDDPIRDIREAVDFLRGL